jgi:hypothetical protein
VVGDVEFHGGRSLMEGWWNSARATSGVEVDTISGITSLAKRFQRVCQRCEINEGMPHIIGW